MDEPIMEIGLIAGEVWHFIDNKGGESTLSDILKSIKHSQEFDLMSVGWLAREGQVFLEPLGKDFKVAIKRY